MKKEIEVKKQKVSILKLKNHEKNPRKHSEMQIQELQRSVKMFGQFRPVIVDEENIILAGHGLVKAMTDAGYTSVDIIRYTGLSKSQKNKLLLVDNRIQNMGMDDVSLIKELVLEITDVDIPGYDKEVIALIKKQDEEDEAYIKTQNKVFQSEYPAGDTDFFDQAEEAATQPELDVVICPHCGAKIPKEYLK